MSTKFILPGSLKLNNRVYYQSHQILTGPAQVILMSTVYMLQGEESNQFSLYISLIQGKIAHCVVRLSLLYMLLLW